MQLNADPHALGPTYARARPFPHVVLDGLFPDEVLDRLLAEFPAADDDSWRVFDNPQEKKLGVRFDAELGDNLKSFLLWMNTPPVLTFLEALTGIEGLIGDPYFGGGGPHRIERGGFLKIHADFNVHPKLHLHRRLNLLVYLNRDWREEYGGHLELWDREMTRPLQRILPVFNRTVVFSTTDTSYHGHPTPLTCPEGRSRRSVSFYYYTAERPEAEVSAAHDTLFRQRHEGEW